MNNKGEINVLVLGAGGNVSQGIIKALRESRLPLRLFGACVCEYSKGLYMCDEGYICPYANDDRFVPWVVDFCNNNDIDIIFTGVEENIIELAKHEEIIRNSTNAVFISSSYKQLIIGQDKYLTCKFLEESGCNFPTYKLWENINDAVMFADTIGYPIIAKPRNGKSSRGIYLIQDALTFEHLGPLDNYVLEQCIGSSESEYTIGCYVNKDGKLQKMIPMHRKLWNGTTVWAKTIENQDIINECTKICNAFKPKGPFNIQLRLDSDGKPVCFELNVRFSGTTSIRSHFGFQDVKAMILEYILSEDIISCFDIKAGEVFRFDEEFYLSENTTNEMRSKRMINNIKEYLFNSEGTK